MKKRFLLCTLGTLGDFYPFLSLGKSLLELGHEVCLATHAEYKLECREAGIQFLELGPSLRGLDQLWPHLDKKDFLKHIMGSLNSALDFNFKQLMAQEFDVLINHPLSLVGPVVAAKKSKPWISVALTPFGLFSAYEPPIFPQIPGFANPKNGFPWLYRPLMMFADRLQRPLAQPILSLYRKNGLPAPVKNPIALGQFSPFGTWALFDPEFAVPQPDWPVNTQVLGFPRWPGTMPALAKEKPKPKIVVGLGSMWNLLKDSEIRNLLSSFASTTEGVLFVGGKKTEKIRELLPLESKIQLCEKVNYFEVLPHADLFINSGGIGAIAEGRFHRVWQIIIPLANDQFDNAKRVERKKWGQVLPRECLSGKPLDFVPQAVPAVPSIHFTERLHSAVFALDMFAGEN